MTPIEIETTIWFYYTAAWHECTDVLQDPGPQWEYGLPGNDPMDLVATTGILTFTLDNSDNNSAGLAGYYSPGHANCPSWFTDDLPVKVVVERLDTHAEGVRFIGECMGFRPTSGLYGEQTTEVEAHDWMEHVSVQKLGQLPITAAATADEALTLALANFDIQPTATDFDVGDETWDYVFVTDDSVKMSMASLFQKLARNELGGHIFLEGDGTLRFDKRSYRPGVTVAAFTLDATIDHPMSELDVAWLRRDIKNRIECKCFPSVTDAAATTVLWELQQTFPIAAEQTVVLQCPYRDPATGARISGIDVVDPLVEATHIKLGTVDDGSTHDIHTFTSAMEVGGNTAQVTIHAINEATTNYCKNPSFEVNVTDDWTIGGAGGTRTQDATKYKIGTKSCKLHVEAADVALSTTAGVSVPNGGTVTVSGWMWRVGAGDDVRLLVWQDGVGEKARYTSSTIGAWEYGSVSWTNTTGGAVTCLLVWNPNNVGTAYDCYVDGSQLELQTAATTYCDGTQPGCSWAGTAHNSTSSRPAGQAGYVNFLQILGKGIYTYEPMVQSDEDTTSIAAIGERPLAINLDLISDPNRGQAYATLLLGLLKDSHVNIERVSFLANYNSDFATAAITVEPNTRFAIVEPQTGLNAHYYACRLRFEQIGPQLWVTIVPTHASSLNYFIWDTADHGWDEGVWTF